MSKGCFPIKGMPMKQTTITILLTALAIVGCSESSSTKSSNSSSNNQAAACTFDYYTNPACPGYGQTTGGTTSGTTGGTTGGGNYTTIPSDNNWQALYPSGEPTGTCSSPTGSGFPPRRGTVTVAGGQMYSPANPWFTMGDEYSGSGYSHNVSYFLNNVNDAKGFVDTDLGLRVRVKPRPQPRAPTGKTWCFGRVTGQASDTWGYTVLRYSVSVRPVNADGSLGPFMGTTSQTTSVNSCSTPIDFSGFSQSASAVNGLVVVIHDIQSNQGCTYQQGCTAFRAVRAASCVQMDIEASVDGTQTF